MDFLALYVGDPHLPSAQVIAAQALEHKIEVCTILSADELEQWVPPKGRHGTLLLRQTGLEYHDRDLIVARQLGEKHPLLKLSPHPEAISALRGKEKQAQWFKEHLFPHPQTWSLRLDSLEEIKQAIADDQGEHFILKPERSLKGLGSVVLDSKRSALSLVSGMKLWSDQRFVLQPQIPIREEWRLLFFADGLPPYCLHKLPDGDPLHWQGNRGHGFKETLKDASEVPQPLLELGKRAFKASGLEMAGIDLIVGPLGAYLLEINMAPGFAAFEGAAKRLILTLLKKV